MGAPAIPFFSGDPTEPGVAGASVNVRQWGQITFYPDVVDIGGVGTDWVEWRVQRSPDDVDWHDVIVIGQKFITTPGTDEDPADYRNRYTGAGGLGLKPSLMMPLNSSFVRIFAQRAPGAVDADLIITAELSGFGGVQDIGGG